MSKSYKFTHDQIDTAWTRATGRYGTKGIAAEHIFWAFAELGIKRCEECGGEDNRNWIEKSLLESDPCPNCNGEGWVIEKEVSDEQMG